MTHIKYNNSKKKSAKSRLLDRISILSLASQFAHCSFFCHVTCEFYDIGVFTSLVSQNVCNHMIPSK